MSTITTIKAGELGKTITLHEGKTLTIKGAANSAGVAYLLDPALGGTNSSKSWIVGVGALPPIGPFDGIQKVLVTCSAGSIEGSVGEAVLNSPQVSDLPGGLKFPSGTLYGAGGIVPAARTATAVAAAMSAVAIMGAGFVQLEAADYVANEPNGIQLISGVSVRGVTPLQTFTSDIADKDWSISGGTRWIGNSSNPPPVFYKNNVALASPQANFCANILANVELSGMAFINCKRPIDIGAKNNAGAANCKFDKLYFQDCAEWALHIENYAHCDFGFFFDRSDLTTGGAYYYGASVATAIWEPGNSWWSGRMFTTRSSIYQRGIVFAAYNGGTLNQVHVEDAQSNRFGGSEVTGNLTMTSGTSDIVVPSVTNYPLGLPLVATSAGSTGVPVGPTLFVVYSDAGTNTIRLGNRPSGTATVAAASGTVAFKTKGFFLFEAISEDSSSSSALTQCSFKGLDLEGTSSGAFLATYTQNCSFEVNQAFTAQYHTVVLRNAPRVILPGQAYPAVVDADAASADYQYFGQRGAIPSYSYAGRGSWYDPTATSEKNIISLNPTATGPWKDIWKEQISGVAHMMRAGSPLIVAGKRVNNGGAVNLAWSDHGDVTLRDNGGSRTVTLPAIGATVPSGTPFNIFNASTQTHVVNTSGELFNGQAGKTSYSLAAGQWLTARVSQGVTGDTTAIWNVMTNGT